MLAKILSRFYELQSEWSQLLSGESFHIMNNDLDYLYPRQISPSFNFFFNFEKLYVFMYTPWPYYEACWILVPWPGIEPMFLQGSP